MVVTLGFKSQEGKKTGKRWEFVLFVPFVKLTAAWQWGRSAVLWRKIEGEKALHPLELPPQRESLCCIATII